MRKPLHKKKRLWASLFCFLTLALFSYTFGARLFLQPDLTVIGFVNMADGVGRQSVDIIKTFKDELRISFIETRPSKLNDVPKDIQRLLKNRFRKSGKVVLFEDILWWPYEEKYKKVTALDPSSLKLAYTMVESTQVPQEWVQILNTHFDAAIVPDPFLVEVYKNNGVEVPIFVLPLGLHLDELLAAPLKNQANTPFIFGNLGVCSDRKNQLLLVRAFAKAFGNNPHVKLRINCRSGEKEVSQAISEEVSKLGLGNIQFTQFCLNKADYLSLFKSLDCYVSISKGEGFSIQPREAMALGVPVIATDNTAQTTLCHSKLVRAIPSLIKEPALYPWGNFYGHSFNCSVDDVAEAMREVYENYAAHLEKSAPAREWARQYQYGSLKALYTSLIKPRSVTLGKVNRITAEGIETTSEILYNKYKELL